MLGLIALSCSSSNIGDQSNLAGGATGEPVVYIQDSLRGGQPRELGSKIYFYQDADPTTADDDFQYFVYLSAKGGTQRSGEEGAYTWSFTADSDASAFLKLGLFGGKRALYSIDESADPRPPVSTGIYALTLTVTSDENRSSTRDVRLVVLANHGADPSRPWNSTGRAGKEYENDTGGVPDGNNPAGKEASNNCNSGGGYYEWLNTGETARTAFQQGTGELDCFRFRVVEPDVTQSFIVEELNPITKPDDADCSTEPFPSRDYSFLMQIGRQQGATWCPTIEEISGYYDNHVADKPGAVGAIAAKQFPQLEQTMPFALVRAIDETSSATYYVQAARCDPETMACVCDPPAGSQKNACAIVERLPGQRNIWRLSFAFSSKNRLRSPTDSVGGYPFLENGEIFHSGPGDYYLMIRNESSTALGTTANYSIHWPLPEGD